jgi:NCAIR mutase (PurE)-related protein
MTQPPSNSSSESFNLDFDRESRCGFAEVVYGPGKPPGVLCEIVLQLIGAGQPVLVTRVDPAQEAALSQVIDGGIYHETARTFRVPRPNAADDPQTRISSGLPVAVVSAGTGDLPVATEAIETLRWMGVEVREIFDVGVAGPHRLQERVDELPGCAAIIVVAGMEGALPSVVGGHVNCPVIGVPTSVGYGANLGGWSALLSMLNSCAANVTVVNIDAGFKAGYLAGLIASPNKP